MLTFYIRTTTRNTPLYALLSLYKNNKQTTTSPIGGQEKKLDQNSQITLNQNYKGLFEIISVNKYDQVSN